MQIELQRQCPIFFGFSSHSSGQIKQERGLQYFETKLSNDSSDNQRNCLNIVDPKNNIALLVGAAVYDINEILKYNPSENLLLRWETSLKML